MSQFESEVTHAADAVRSRLDDARSQLQRLDGLEGPERGFASSPTFAQEEVGFASSPAFGQEEVGFASQPGQLIGRAPGESAHERGFASGGGFEQR